MNPDKDQIDFRCHLLQYVIETDYGLYPPADVGVQGAGWLDLDASIKKDFGQF